MLPTQRDIINSFRDRIMRGDSIVLAARSAAGLSIEELARKTSIPVARIDQFERGGASPNVAEQSAIFRATNVPSDLLSG